jgi:hypothetical protein
VGRVGNTRRRKLRLHNIESMIAFELNNPFSPPPILSGLVKLQKNWLLNMLDDMSKFESLVMCNIGFAPSAQ